MRRRRRGRGDPRPAPAPSHLAAARRRGRRGGRARRGGGHSVRHGPVHHGGPPAPRGVMRRPTRWLGLALAAATLPPWGGGRAAAQTGPQTNLVLTVAAGVVNGGSLWTIPRQPFCPAFNGSCTAGYDTLRLARELGSSNALGLAVIYFTGPGYGYLIECVLLGLHIDVTVSLHI